MVDRPKVCTVMPVIVSRENRKNFAHKFPTIRSPKYPNEVTAKLQNGEKNKNPPISETVILKYGL